MEAGGQEGIRMDVRLIGEVRVALRRGNGLGVVVHVCNSNYLGARDKRIMVLDQPRQKD
jgi:hypothetical protein